MGSTALPPPRLRLRARDPAAAGEVFELREPPRKRGAPEACGKGRKHRPPARRNEGHAWPLRGRPPAPPALALRGILPQFRHLWGLKGALSGRGAPEAGGKGRKHRPLTPRT